MLDDNLARKEVVLDGFVYEVQEGGWSGGIAISTGDEDYLVEMNEQSQLLSKEIENDVRVKGFVTRSPDGRNRIQVTGFEVIQDAFEHDSYRDLYGDDII